MKYLIILLILTVNSSFCQGIDNLHYSKSTVPYRKTPVKQIKKLLNEAEKRWYRNKEDCNEIKKIIIYDLDELTIDSINIKYRNGLKKNLEVIDSLQLEGHYGDYTLIIDDIVTDLENNQLNYENEEKYKTNVLYNKLKNQEEENKRLTNKLESQKKIQNKPFKKKSINKKK